MLSTDALDFALSDEDFDLIIENGDIVLSKGLDGVAQLIHTAIGMIKGEWFLDLTVGIAQFERDGVTADQALMGQPFDQRKAVKAYRDVISTVPGVTRIDFITATYDNPTRVMTVSWQVTTIFDDTITDSTTVNI